MGKATILGSGARNLQRGQYRVRIEKSDSRAEAEIRRIDGEVSAIDSAMSSLYSDYLNSERAYRNASSDLNAIIQQSTESPDSDYSDQLSSATAAERSAAIDYGVAKNRYQSARLKKRSIQGKRKYLTDHITEDIRTVWCADCQRSLSGTVATIEIPNTDDTILIRPGGPDGSGSDYLTSRDGQLRSVAAMSPAEATYAFTMFPGWQKWQPTYRLGKILERIPNNSQCTVLLDSYSTAQGLATDTDRRLTNVPMTYKGRTDGGPYQVGDRVVVEFQDQNRDAPRVVGFESDPCTTSCTTSTAATTTTIPYEYILLRGDGVLEQRSIEDGTIIESYNTNIYTSPLSCPYPNGPATKYHAIAKIPDGYIMQNTEFQILLVYDDLARTTLLDSFTINYPDIYGYLPSCGDYPEYVIGYIRDLAYDSVTGNLIATISNTATSYTDSLIVVYSGISNTVLTTFTITEPDQAPGGTGPGIYGIVVHNGNIIVSGQYIDKNTLLSVGKIWVLDGLTSTVTDSFYYPTGGSPPGSTMESHYFLDMAGSDLMGYHYRDATGSPPTYISPNFVLHDGITADALYNYSLPTTITIEGRQVPYVHGICLL